jgi:Ca-activated chloride channel family protein
VPQPDAAGLQRLAAAGGGRYAALTTSDRDLDALFPAPSALALDAALDPSADEGGEQYEADVWLDRGLVLAVLLLPLLALCFRRGWIAVWAIVVVAPLPRHANAFEWQDLWQRRDQQGIEALDAQEPVRAAELFENPEWRSAAQYRAEQFEASAASLANVDSPLGHYNRGNALAKSGQIPAAIAAYDRALELDPKDEDARYNRDLLQQFLEDNPDQQQEQQGAGLENQQGDSSGDQSQNGEQQDGEASDEQQSEQGEQGESGDSRAADGAQEQPDEQNEGEQGQEQNANAEQQAAEEAVADASAPEEVEKWASEQAAEQWLRRVPQDPGGLLRRKFLYQYQRQGVDQNGNRIVEGAPAERRPW